MKVLCFWYATEEEKNYIKNAMPPGTEVVAPKGSYFSRFDCAYADVKDLLSDADAIIAFSVPPGALEKAEKLKVFSWLHSGVDDLRQMGVLRLFMERGVKCANVRGANAIAVAEQAMMFIFALAKKTVFKDDAIRHKRTLFPLYADEYRSTMLDGRTLGLVGVGEIGGRIAKYAKGFDMRVVGVRRNKGQAVEHVDEVYGLDDLHQVLRQSDYVVLAAPNTPETHQFFGRAELEAMKPSAFLVNIARGMLIQEKALYEALTSGRLRGFGSDCWWNYPFGTAFPAGGGGSRLGIHRLPNVVGSDDQSANADDVLVRLIEWGTQNILEFVNRKPLSREVRLDLGY
ncbi:phosphoglycerate dehydrogenase [Bradyrhizobium sp. CCBAU 11430]|uniref:2-hydroxyacid dehydrogenase n=1 Tax=Bradyrhizobium sp. CCBAU 11430 TaxID=1630881 RepID=UPI002304ED06|nr:2-hydroxyacid dehydrogenase [Bradyrhizobium sp. CCBAU 11430]MDA9513111.1 phosphoglycerate dehydrogenase [Bradyrhizobium sp. CCBAU 11430]